VNLGERKPILLGHLRAAPDDLALAW
jgi:hypothetical protein